MAAKGRQGEEGNTENSFLDDIKKIFQNFFKGVLFFKYRKMVNTTLGHITNLRRKHYSEEVQCCQQTFWCN